MATMSSEARQETPPSTAGADLDPEIRRFVREASAAWAGHPRLDSVTPAEARLIAERVRARWTVGGPAMAAVGEHWIPLAAGSVRVRRYDPGPAGPKPALVYLHGGGWTIFSLETHDRVMREYAARAGVTVLGVDYALAPEARFPVALQQVVGVLRWLTVHGSELGVDSRRLVVAGDSAGANLALAASLVLRDAGDGDAVTGLLLNYGVYHRHSSDEARRRFGGEGYMLSSEDMEGFWRGYLGAGTDHRDPLVSPLEADLAGLPPTLLVVPECDLLTEQSLALRERLQAEGVAADVRVYRGASHSFLEAVSISRLADAAFADSAAWLRSLLGGG